ncbi:hypothetical protein CFE70_005397 [Pyrenophora teres f. teres 0-1]|uniref:Uncharacterized protein n=2 Tax=Pyrenophora teres f. teres TaxID=97479 RepID=E3RMR1_PYRTT|nr:hypothetical protein PTT_09767 [Pyrenophora teres f. teres 0-1]KAE8839074.1 hypothetical protein HRS9139_03457 [Pyrenophora teres f. teres]KAE8845039.1 hypothetical protein PTNB85_03304 [Pyrenophora teres f. teres]KAE8865813.1 hypothetical protein PTNB29_02960 [Pyrenophora teres f. teres]KAE8871448.1 hypothetical protein PTNB73_02907 [Pyrenophora teres f. teres]
MAHRETLQKILEYATEARERQDHVVDFDASSTEARLAQTVKELQARVQEQQAALDKLRSESDVDLDTAAYASEDPRQKLQQLIAVKDAYRCLKPTATYLPGKGSPLPSLLAARTLQQNVQGTKEAIANVKSQLDTKETTLRREEANLHDANQLTQAMEARIERLRAQHADRSQKTPAQLARELIAAKRAQKDAYDADMQRLGQAMNDFINDYLSNMLAAEELGGPVVGDMLDVEDNTLAAGFTKKGRTKSTKKPVSDKTRQRKIDQIWGKKTSAAAEDEEKDPPTEAEAADAEMRQLIENLFATLVGPGGGKAYFQLERDSAASRFLVRAKIAQFHPRDARKLRLIDFGRELDD